MTTIEIIFSIVSTALLLLCLGFYFNAYAFRKLSQKRQERSEKEIARIINYLKDMQSQIDIITSQQEELIKDPKGRDLEPFIESSETKPNKYDEEGTAHGYRVPFAFELDLDFAQKQGFTEEGAILEAERFRQAFENRYCYGEKLYYQKHHWIVAWKNWVRQRKAFRGTH
ncbi:hypothetical protein [Bartonella sp. DGB2]|uniref:hypothetical protein n=1 Tax=Bartonella sp. DGB2 TaxID=3388426 RepID=UPI00398FCAA5